MRSWAFGLFLLIVAPAAPASAERIAAQRPRVEVAFVLDTTGSMAGLIDGAKRKIWSIAERIGDGRPRPELRIALVGYRDVGDQYVTLVHDFSGDIDLVYERLMSFRAEGGGDTPEHVSRALSDAVHRLSWSNGNVMRTIFLVGDAPPHLDYQDGFDYRRHAREAAQRGIVVEAIECGGDPLTAQVWSEIAGLAGGHFARIDSGGGMPARVTPVDAELARLNTELTRTVVAFGSRDERQAAARKLEGRVAMPSKVAAEAASYFAKSDRLAEKDLVTLPEAEQKKALADARADAPLPLKNKSEAEQLAYLKQQQQRRAQLQSQILTLQKQREGYLKQAEPGSGDGFDQQVIDKLKERAEKAGIKY
jgi:hypothetical protein